VSCTGAGDCTAVGQDGFSEPMYATESGGTWGTPTEVLDSPLGGVLSGVSCTDASDCTAVGTDGNTQPIYVTKSGGTWGTAALISGGPSVGRFDGVSCTGAGDCTAVGYAGGPPIYATESGGTWGTPTEVPGSPGSGGHLDGVSCTDASDCTAVGYADSSPGQPIYVTESGGTWGTATGVPGSPGNGGAFDGFDGVSCTAVGDCTAVGQDGNSQPMYATESAQVSQTQTISFTAPASAVVGGSATLTATGRASGNPVVFTVDAASGSGVCTVSGANGATVNYTGAGTCVIDANQAGNATYAAAPQVQQSVTVTLPTVPPAFTSDSPATTGTAGTPYMYTFAASGSPAPTFSVNSGSLPGGLTLNSATGTVSGTPTTAGSFTFTVQAANGVAPAAVSPSMTITVTKLIICAKGGTIPAGYVATAMLEAAQCGGGTNLAGFNAYQISPVAAGDVVCWGTAFEPAQKVPTGYVATAMLDAAQCGSGTDAAGFNAYRISPVAAGDVICWGTSFEPAQKVPTGYVATAMLDAAQCGTGKNLAGFNAYQISPVAAGDVICWGTKFEPAEPVPTGYVKTARLDAAQCGSGIDPAGYNAYQIAKG
jgi:hypothetical protein